MPYKENPTNLRVIYERRSGLFPINHIKAIEAAWIVSEILIFRYCQKAISDTKVSNEFISCQKCDGRNGISKKNTFFYSIDIRIK